MKLIYTTMIAALLISLVANSNPLPLKPPPVIKYVTENGAGSKNGTSWLDAYDKTQLQNAINEAGVAQVWVAAGTYYPTLEVGGTGDRYKTFQMKNNVTIYGGFAGTEILVSERTDFGVGGANETILSGDVGTPNVNTDNSYHVFYHPDGLGLTNAAVLDGFTISGGHADGVAPNNNGAGMYNNNNSPLIKNCIFTSNTANNGGAMFNIANSNAGLVGCEINNNQATESGGGAFWIHDGCQITLTNCLIHDNTSPTWGGGMIILTGATGTLTNCTFTQNGSGLGGGLYNAGGTFVINNSILWGNTSTQWGNQIETSSGISTTLNYSCFANVYADPVYDVEGTVVNNSSITANPEFNDPGNDDFRVKGYSPCVNSGNNAYNSETYDIRGKARIQNTTIDMGSYEWTDGTDPACEPTIEVININDSGNGSLRHALLAVCDNGTITFNASLNNQTITLTSGELLIAKGVTIDATSLSNGITVDGGSTSRIFNIACTSAASVIIKKVNISHGSNGGSGGGIFMDNSFTSLTLKNLTFSNCSANDGAGLYQKDGTLWLSHCAFTSNVAVYNGAGVYLSSSAKIDTCTFSSNIGVIGGALYQKTGTTTNTGSTFNTNNAKWGGAMFIDGGTHTDSLVTFTTNTATGTGSAGGAVWHGDGTLNLKYCTIDGNSAISYGGGIYVEKSTAILNVNGGSVKSNTVSNGNGGGIYINNGVVKINNNAIVNANTATASTRDGGGIYLLSGNLTLDTCYVNNNSAYRNGGGIYVGNANAFLTATGDSISKNSTLNEAGGGLYVFAGNAKLKRTIVKDNFNKHKGAGICIWGSATRIVIDSCNISKNITKNNTSSNLNYGGGLFINNANVTVSNTTFTENSGYNTNNARNPKGGAVYLTQGNLYSLNNTFTSNSVNTSNSLGGAQFNDLGTLINTNCTFESNSSGRNGGAIYNNSSTAITSDSSCIFKSNSAYMIGGAIDLNGGTLNNFNCVFDQNTATIANTNSAGGAIYHNAGTSASKACTFSSNKAYNSAAVDVKAGTATIVNSLFTDNAASASGGAFVSETGTSNSTITNCTFWGNSAVTQGGGIAVQGGTVNVKNSIIWGNTSPNAAQFGRSGGTLNVLYCDYSNGANDVAGTFTPTSCINSNPVFANSASDDFRLVSNSPCIDAGYDSYCAEPYDIRGVGFARKLNKSTGLTGTIDMGAYEFKLGFDPSVPTLEIDTPSQGDVLYANPVTVSGTAADGDDNLSEIQVKLNMGSWQTATGTASWTIDLTLEPGINTIFARAKDATDLYSETDTILVTLSIQKISIPQGWSYISSYLEPTDPNIVNMWADIAGSNNLMILTGVNGIYAPAPFYINTLNNWDVTKGYKVKMNATDELIVSGDSLADKSIDFPAGVHLIPVLTNHTVQLDQVFNDPFNDILYMFDLYANKVYWPNGTVFTLSELAPGCGYLANFKNPVTISYPWLENFTVDHAQNLPPAAGPWPCIRTSAFHLISISAEAIAQLQNADYIGTFDAAGNCVGYAALEKTGQNILLTVYGDESITAENDGLTDGEILQFRIFSINDNSEKELTASFSQAYPNADGLFYINGLSGINGFKESATGVGENDFAAGVQVYPNPARDELNIATKGFLSIDGFGTLLTADGKPVKTFEIKNILTKLDISDLIPGFYILKLESTDSVILKRVVIQ